MSQPVTSARPIRISCKPNDPGYRLWACMGPRQRAGLQIFVDGEQIKAPITADEAAGFVIALALGDDGTVRLDRAAGQAERRTYRGRVEIRSSGRCYLEVLWREAQS